MQHTKLDLYFSQVLFFFTEFLIKPRIRNIIRLLEKIRNQKRYNIKENSQNRLKNIIHVPSEEVTLFLMQL